MKGGELSEFDEFFRTCLPSLTRTLASLSDDNRVVEDVAQEALLIARHRWADVGSYDKPEAWVLKVALRRLRRWQHRHRHETSLDFVPGVDHLAQVDESEALRAALRRLSPRHAEVLALQLLGYSISEMSAVLVITESTVRTHLTRGRAELRKILGDNR